ncbi:MAG: MOFRL family protein, partial [bacterium]
GRLPQRIMQHIRRGDRGLVDQNLREGDPAFANTHSFVIANNSKSVEALSTAAEGMGYRVVSLSSTVAGDTHDAAQTHARLARKILTDQDPVGPPACIVSGGETTVRVVDGGKGGRNQQFVLAAALEIEGLPVSILSVGTDGVDGSTDAAGAICDGDSVRRARRFGLDPVSYLDRNDSYSFFERLGDLVKTGPTGTNVMDIHVVMVGSPDESN